VSFLYGCFQDFPIIFEVRDIRILTMVCLTWIWRMSLSCLGFTQVLESVDIWSMEGVECQIKQIWCHYFFKIVLGSPSFLSLLWLWLHNIRSFIMFTPVPEALGFFFTLFSLHSEGGGNFYWPMLCFNEFFSSVYSYCGAYLLTFLFSYWIFSSNTSI
jgi:hypothetical protein